MELYEKVLVDPSFLDTVHGELGCVACHGGNPDADNMKDAHIGMSADPSFPDATVACGDCHEEEAELAKTSLHYTLGTYKPMVAQRTHGDDATSEMLDVIMDNHCFSCHASCGQCHISRPDYVKGGFIDGHNFGKPDQTNQCMACHGSRVGNEFTGVTGAGDVHFTKHDMDCMACHGTHDVHGDGNTGHKDRYDVEGLANCLDCHELDDSIEQHAIHGESISCYVCHAQPYSNCYTCHVGLDDQGLDFFKNPVTKQSFMIGLNPDPNPNRPEDWMLVRRIPVTQTSFDFYKEDLLTNFDQLNNWKYTSPHNIQRKTKQNRSCNNCHGNEDIFLTEDKVLPEMRAANKDIIVPFSMIPEEVEMDEEEIKPRRTFF